MKTTNRILRLPEVVRVTGICRSSIYLQIKEKTFPAPIKLGARSVGWIEEEIQAWIDQRINDSRVSNSAS